MKPQNLRQQPLQPYKNVFEIKGLLIMKPLESLENIIHWLVSPTILASTLEVCFKIFSATLLVDLLLFLRNPPICLRMNWKL